MTPRQTSKLLLDEAPLQVLPSLAVKIGLKEALVLQQLQYRLRPARHMFAGKSWFYASYAYWQREFPFWCERTIRRIFATLEARGYIESRPLATDKADRTKWYTVNYEALDAEPGGTPSGKTVPRSDKMATSLTEKIPEREKPLQDFPSSREEEDPPAPIPASASAVARPVPPEEEPAHPAAVPLPASVPTPPESVQTEGPASAPRPDAAARPQPPHGQVSPVYQNGMKTAPAARAVPLFGCHPPDPTRDEDEQLLARYDSWPLDHREKLATAAREVLQQEGATGFLLRECPTLLRQTIARLLRKGWPSAAPEETRDAETP